MELLVAGFLNKKMDNGFISLHRKIKENPIWQDRDLAFLFIHLLLSANHQRKKILRKGQEEWIERGQLKTGRNLLSLETGIPPGSIWRMIDSLRRLGILSIKSSNKYSIITIIKYNDYQLSVKNMSSKISYKRATGEQQVSTNNNDNNINNEIINHSAQGADETNQLFKIFYDTINPNINYAHKGNRDAAKWLINKYGLEKVLNAAKFAISVQGKPYAPTINTPSQLKIKMADLVAYQQKEQTKLTTKKKGLVL